MAEGTHENDKLGVFISYSREDLGYQLDVTLRLAGFNPKIDRHGIHGAENWQEKSRPSRTLMRIGLGQTVTAAAKLTSPAPVSAASKTSGMSAPAL